MISRKTVSHREPGRNARNAFFVQVSRTSKPDRIEAERAFHNDRFFEAESRKESSKYYLALEQWYQHYSESVRKAEVFHVLEIGSGVESISMQFECAPFELQSIDISEEAIHFTRTHARLQNAHFSVQDAHYTSFPDASFDLVIGRGILHHLELSVACKEIRRVLRPDGAVLFGEPMNGNLLINLYRRLTPGLRTRDERPLSSKDITILRDCFGKVNLTYYGFLTLIPAVFGCRAPRMVHVLDHFILNKIGLGKFFAWACILSTATEHK